MKSLGSHGSYKMYRTLISVNKNVLVYYICNFMSKLHFGFVNDLQYICNYFIINSNNEMLYLLQFIGDIFNTHISN